MALRSAVAQKGKNNATKQEALYDPDLSNLRLKYSEDFAEIIQDDRRESHVETI